MATSVIQITPNPYVDVQVISSPTDLNDIRMSGFYSWGASNYPDNLPRSGPGFMIQLQQGSSRGCQIVYSNASAAMYCRRLESGTWSNWSVLQASPV